MAVTPSTMQKGKGSKDYRRTRPAYRNIRPESIRADNEEIRSIVGRQMDRLGELIANRYAEKGSDAGRRAVLMGVANGLGYLEATLVKDLPDNWEQQDIVKKIRAEFKKPFPEFRAGDLIEWYRQMAIQTKGLMPVPHVILDFEDDDAEIDVVQEDGTVKKKIRDPAEIISLDQLDD